MNPFVSSGDNLMRFAFLKWSSSSEVFMFQHRKAICTSFILVMRSYPLRTRQISDAGENFYEYNLENHISRNLAEFYMDNMVMNLAPRWT